MDFRIEKTLAEEFAGFMEESRSYGQNWVTFNVQKDTIADKNWVAFTKKLDAFENAEIGKPDMRAADINDLLPEIYKVIDQTPEQMQQSVNYYELKTQLADLGYNTPEVADQLRTIVSQNEFDQAIVHTLRDGVKFEIELERNSKGDFEVLFNHALLDLGNEFHSSYLKPDVPLVDAVKQLKQQIINPKNQENMNTENLSYLQKQLLNLGFGESMNKELEKNIEAKTPEFTLNNTNEYNKQNVDYTLHFKAGSEQEMHFFNKYDAKLNDTQQTFYINKGSGITAKEAFNLMEGRAVHKELENKDGEKYKAWVTLDQENKTENGNLKLKTFSDGWNYKPERAIDKMDIVGINEEGARDKLMKSLEKGNRHQVTALKDGKEVKLFIEANPAEHRVNLTNWKGEAQQLEHYKKPEAKQEQKKAKTQETSKKKSKGAKMSV